MKCRSLLLTLVTLLCASSAAGQTVTAGATSGANSEVGVGVQASPQQSITYNTNSGGTLRNVPSIFAPSFQPSTPCSSALSASVGVAGFGLALGGTHVDKDCNLREMARLLHLIGQPDAAVALICVDPEVARTSPQLCARAAYVSGRAEDYITSERPVMPPAPIRPQPATVTQPLVAEGSIGYDPQGRKYVYRSGVWSPDTTPAQAVGAHIPGGAR